MRRREFITLLGGAAAAGPVAVRAQQVEGVRRIAVLMGAAETASSRSWIAALLHRLDELGWREGRNLVMQVQWWNDQPEQMRVWAAELLARMKKPRRHLKKLRRDGRRAAPRPCQR